MTLAELKQKRPVTITVQQAAKILGVTPRYIQAVLQQDTTAKRLSSLVGVTAFTPTGFLLGLRRKIYHGGRRRDGKV